MVLQLLGSLQNELQNLRELGYNNNKVVVANINNVLALAILAAIRTCAAGGLANGNVVDVSSRASHLYEFFWNAIFFMAVSVNDEHAASPSQIQFRSKEQGLF